MEHAQVAIIGAGPIGIEAAVALGRAEISCIHLEAGSIGSTMGWWAPGTRFFSSPERIAIAGVPLLVEHQEKATREHYLQYLRQVTEQFNLSIKTFERVIDISHEANAFILSTERSVHGVGSPHPYPHHEPHELSSSSPSPSKQNPACFRQYRVEKIILAIGNMHAPRMVSVPGEDLPHVSHYLDDPHIYFGKQVLIVGGRNSAVEAAIRLYRAGARVTLCQRRTELERKRIKYWLLPELEWLIKQHHIDFLPGATLDTITPETVSIKTQHNQTQTVAADFVLLLTGYIQDTSLFSMLGVSLHTQEHKPVFDTETMQTTVPGVYVAGTAVGGSALRTKVFIENAHEHVEKIVRAIAGREVLVRGPVVFEGNEES